MEKNFVYGIVVGVYVVVFALYVYMCLKESIRNSIIEECYH